MESKFGKSLKWLLDGEYVDESILIWLKKIVFQESRNLFSHLLSYWLTKMESSVEL